MPKLCSPRHSPATKLTDATERRLRKRVDQGPVLSLRGVAGPESSNMPTGKPGIDGRTDIGPVSRPAARFQPRFAPSDHGHDQGRHGSPKNPCPGYIFE